MFKILKKISILLIISFPIVVSAQKKEDHLPGWQFADLKDNGILGISMNKTYAELLKKKKRNKVIVAVIDGGVDINHEDLKNVIYINKKEIPDNGIDDDGNGYIDDVKGWNFLGSSKGSFRMDNMESVRILRKELKKDSVSDEAVGLRLALMNQLLYTKDLIKPLSDKLALLKKMKGKIAKDKPDIDDFRTYKYQNYPEAQLLVELVRTLKYKSFVSYYDSLDRIHTRLLNNFNYQLNVDYDPRGGSEYKNKYHGNPDSKGPDPYHGTHVAGILAADRTNRIGIQGIADQVSIMPLRIVPAQGEVMDEDIAAAILYAVDNGARVINMSLGKYSSSNQQVVDNAVKYAMSKDVLIVHAAGNDGRNLAKTKVYPNKSYLDGSEAEAWIEVGANDEKDNENLMPWFSNYGKDQVDVFAPGTEIYATLPENSYGKSNGTSMAAPVVSGLAAMIRSYYPKLTAVQVKEAIVKSVQKINHNVIVYDSKESVPFSKLCKSGGVVNAFSAFEYARSF